MLTLYLIASQDVFCIVQVLLDFARQPYESAELQLRKAIICAIFGSILLLLVVSTSTRPSQGVLAVVAGFWASQAVEDFSESLAVDGSCDVKGPYELWQ